MRAGCSCWSEWKVAPLPRTSSACAWVCRRIASNRGWPGVTPSRLFVSAASRRGGRRLEGVRQARDGLERERHELGRLAEEARDGLRHDAAFLRPRAPLDQHLEVELLAREPFEGVLAEGAKLPLVHVAEQALFEVGVAEASSVVVAQYALDVGRRQDLANHV